jgi:hypothetical protein
MRPPVPWVSGGTLWRKQKRNKKRKKKKTKMEMKQKLHAWGHEN